MEIKHIGHSCFRLRGKKAILVTDPFDPDMLGIKFPTTEADIVTISHLHGDHNFRKGIAGAETIFIDGPGEYEVKGVKIIGISSFHDTNKGEDRGKNTIYRIDMEGISIVHLGDLGHLLDEAAVDTINGIDILFVPVGGFYTIGPDAAIKIVNQLEPSMIIPMHYATENLSSKISGQLKGVKTFLDEMGKEEIPPQNKITVSKDKLPAGQTVVILE